MGIPCPASLITIARIAFGLKKQGSYFEPDFRPETRPFFESAFSFNAYSDGR
jgi:hypothetical protein